MVEIQSVPETGSIEPILDLDLLEKIRTGQARVAVIGLGDVGLPLATAFAEAGLNVVGLDVDDRKVSAVCLGHSYVDDIDSYTFAAQVRAGRLRATTDAAVLSYDRHARLIELAGEINDRTPDLVVDRIAEALNSQRKSLRDSRILLIGVSYMRDVGDVRESPALKAIERLRRKGAAVSYHDPFVPTCVVEQETMASVTLDEESVRGADCVVILTDHTDLPYDRILRDARVIVDTRNVLRAYDPAKVVRL